MAKKKIDSIYQTFWRQCTEGIVIKYPFYAVKNYCQAATAGAHITQHAAQSHLHSKSSAWKLYKQYWVCWIIYITTFLWDRRSPITDTLSTETIEVINILWHSYNRIPNVIRPSQPIVLFIWHCKTCEKCWTYISYNMGW